MFIQNLNCNILLSHHFGFMSTRRLPLFLQRRLKHKKKWATNRKPKTASELALEQFDTFYKPVYGKLWPSLRVALLSQKKYCALVNNFSTDESISNRLANLGAKDMIAIARQTETSKLTQNKDTSRDSQNDTASEQKMLQTGINGTATQNNTTPDNNTMDNVDWHERSITTDSRISSSGQFQISHAYNCDTNLDEFMPVEKVYSKKEMLVQNIIDQSVFDPRDIQAETVLSTEFDLPPNLEVYTYSNGDVSVFPVPKPDAHGIVGYYLLDAASILPIIALDIQPSDSVLDLCAAPGGKSLAILQCCQPSVMTCNDLSGSRLRRVKTVLQWYYPDVKDITFTQSDGRHLKDPLYSKVIVDVPCNTDRHVLSDNENNLFQPKRVGERLKLPTIQKELLIAGIQSCKPGGSVIYSTCTLSPAQNDGVVQAAIEEVWQDTEIDLVIQDLGWMAEKFQKTFKFYNNCRHGQLVLPNLVSNFGPMYFSKITRLA